MNQIILDLNNLIDINTSIIATHQFTLNVIYYFWLTPLVPCTLNMSPGIKNSFLFKKKTDFLDQIFKTYLGNPYVW